jgi:hypothetical protein
MVLLVMTIAGHSATAFPDPGELSFKAGVRDEACPARAIVLTPGISIQAAIDRAGDGAAFCLKPGLYRMQAVRPKPRQGFYGESRAILNGSRLLTTFAREERYWVARLRQSTGQGRGRCLRDKPGCNLPQGVFLDDRPLQPVVSKNRLGVGRFYLDGKTGRLFLTEDPAGHKLEATSVAAAFESGAPSVLIRNIVIEKYGNFAGRGAIQARSAKGWRVENCEVRLNSGEGIEVGNSTRVWGSDVHHNGQLGISGAGNDILIEHNEIWGNNIRGFDFKWEAGGVKLVMSNHVVLRRNHVHDNVGPGLWCDINCRDILYEGNLVEANADSGIYHEISFSAVVRDNVLRHNGNGHRIWFWGSEIVVSASEGVDVYGNSLTVSAGGCGIMLIDQSRDIEGGGKYKTRYNKVHQNETSFEGPGCAGGASDAEPGDANYAIITDGNNIFDADVYRVPRSGGSMRFSWGHKVYDWASLSLLGMERNGQLIID